MGEQIGKKVVGEYADITFDVIIEDEPGRDGRLVLSPSPPAPPRRIDDTAGGGHCYEAQAVRDDR